MALPRNRPLIVVKTTALMLQKNTDNTIIMEEILKEFGHTISSNGNHTQ